MKIAYMGDRLAFAARRRKAQSDVIAALEPVVTEALAKKREGSDTWWRPVVDASHTLWNGIVKDDGGDPAKALGDWARVSLDMAHALTKTKSIDEHSASVIATFLAGMILDSATIAAADQAGEDYEIEWVSMHDTKVRHTHKIADGQTIKRGEKFMVGGAKMDYPHDTTAPIKEWINCRCTVAPVPVHEKTAAAVDTDRAPRGVIMQPRTWSAEEKAQWSTHLQTITAANSGPDNTGLIPWHGPLAPVGVWSGDGRRFGSLDTRDLGIHPLPLGFQEKTAQAHDDAPTVASIEWAEMRDDTMWGGGHFMQTEAADQAVGVLAHFGKYGVSVDADDAEMELEFAADEDGEMMPTGRVTYNTARVCGAVMVSIPAFQEAWVTLGEDPNHDYGTPPADLAAALDEMVGDFASLPDGSFPIDNCKDLKNAIQAIGRAKDPAKAKAHIRRQKSRLGCPDVDLPDTWAAEEETFGRGPGWITNPEDTARIHDYWTVPGQPGYEKIQWGVPGDFNRCKVEIGQEIAEKDPATVAKYMNQICSQWHHDATGFWPGHAPLEGGSLETPEGEPAPALTIVASAASAAPPADWFSDPGLTEPTPIQFVEEGGLVHIFGHVNLWGLCHMGFNTGECVNPGPSTNDYAYYRCGEVMTTDGAVATGPVTVSTGHADGRMGMRPALAHYDNTGTAVADVAAGDDDHGTWINGWVRPWATEEQKYNLRANPPSGDWRRNPNTGDMEMIAVLAVNAPGLPVRRIGYSGGQQVSLVASLEVTEREDEDVVEDIAEKIAAALEDRARRRDLVAALATEFEKEE